jgi:hypothetical protein
MLLSNTKNYQLKQKPVTSRLLTPDITGLNLQNGGEGN